MAEIVALWAVVRSTSTAFEWMMRVRGDMTCFHEPFGEAWYKGDDARWPDLKPDSERVLGLTTTGVLDRLLAAAAERPVFIKDMPQHTVHLWSEAFFDHFVHSFLIRDPAKVLTSTHKMGPSFTLRMIGCLEQQRLFERLADRQGSPPPVIDSDELLEDPHGIVAAWCAAVGIPFLPEALSWTPGARDEVGWYDKGSWHENLRNSDGLKPQPRTAIDLAEAPDAVKRRYELALPAYTALHRHRLRAISD